MNNQIKQSDNIEIKVVQFPTTYDIVKDFLEYSKFRIYDFLFKLSFGNESEIYNPKIPEIFLKKPIDFKTYIKNKYSLK